MPQRTNRASALLAPLWVGRSLGAGLPSGWRARHRHRRWPGAGPALTRHCRWPGTGWEVGAVLGRPDRVDQRLLVAAVRPSQQCPRGLGCAVPLPSAVRNSRVHRCVRRPVVSRTQSLKRSRRALWHSCCGGSANERGGLALGLAQGGMGLGARPAGPKPHTAIARSAACARCVANGHWCRYDCASHPVARRVLHVASCSTDTRGGLVTLQLFVLIIAIPVGSVLNLDESVATVCCNCVLQSMYMVAAVHH